MLIRHLRRRGGHRPMATAFSNRGSTFPRPRRLLLEPLEERALLSAAPQLLDLQAGSDSGLYDDDDLTNISTPTIDITADQADDVIRVYDDGAFLGEATQVAGTSYQYDLAPGQLAEGVNSITARSFDGIEESVDSEPLVITLDTTAPVVASVEAGIGLTFDGVDDYVAVPAGALDGLSDMTAEFWLKVPEKVSEKAPEFEEANLLVNGSFETGSTVGWDVLTTDGQDPHYVITGSSDRVSHGRYAVNFNYGHLPANVILSQTFPTTIGKSYNVSFDFGAVTSDGLVASLQLDLLGSDGSTPLIDSLDLSESEGPIVWATKYLSFVADGPTATLLFTDTTVNSIYCDALLDHVVVTGGPEAILSGANGENDNEYLVSLGGGDTVRLHTGQTSDDHVSWTVPSVADDQWHHFAVVRDDANDRAVLYLDGQSQGTRAGVFNPLSISPGGFVIGQDQDSVGGGFDPVEALEGELAEVRIWDATRSQSAIRADMLRRLDGTEPGLVGYWPLDEGVGTTAADLNFRGRDGLLGGGDTGDPAARPAWGASELSVQRDALWIAYSDAYGMDPSTVTDPADYQLLRSGGDGTFGDGNEVDVSAGLSAVRFDETSDVVSLKFANPFAEDFYQLMIAGTAGVLDLAGNELLDGSDYTSQTLEIISEPTTVAVDLQAGSDSGFSDQDNITNVTTPTFDVIVNKRGLIEVDFDGDGVTDTSQGVEAAGTYPFTASEYADGAYQVAATFTPLLGDVGSDTLHVTIDTQGPQAAHVAYDPANTALSFDGANDFVEVAHAADLDFGTGDFTVELWINYNDLSGEQVLIEKWTEAPSGWTLTKLGGNTLRLALPSGGFDVSIPDLTPDTWHHVGLARSGDVFTLFWDGVPLASASAENLNLDYSGNLLIGRRGDGRGFFFNGMMDEVRIWNVAQSQSEIQTNMSRLLLGTESGLVAYWGFDDGSGSTAEDLSGHGNHGVLGAGNPESEPAWIQSTAPLPFRQSDNPRLPVSVRAIGFNEPIAPDSFGVDDIELLTPDGVVDPADNALTPLGGNTYRVTFPEQTADGTYHLLIGPDVHDLAGNPMDQDDDGQPGEDPEDVYDDEFTLAIGPRVTASTPDSPIDLDALSSVTLTFNEAVNSPLDHVAFLGPEGAILPTGSSSIDGTQWEITFNPQTRGTYTVLVGPGVTDLADNLMDQDQDGILGEQEDDIYTFSFDAFDADTVFTFDTEIASGDTSFDGQDICIVGVTLTIDGTHQFNSVQLVEGAVLTHTAGLAEPTDRLVLTVDGDVIVSTSSSISVDGKGYAGGEGPGAGSTGDSGGGGGHGGSGGDGEVEVEVEGLGGSSYGSIVEPVDLGSGGGFGWQGGIAGEPGGGAIRLTVGGTLLVEGSLTANGEAHPTEWGPGAGSGGSIYLTVGKLDGGGVISANGGYGQQYEGGGGGGRIAIEYGTNLFAGQVSAYGGSGYQDGGAGTIFTKLKGETWGNLLIDHGGNLGAETPLTDDWESLEQMTVTVANRAIVYPEPGLRIGILQVASGGVLSYPAGQAMFDLTVLNDATIDVGGAISADGQGYAGGEGPGAGGTGEHGGGGGHGGSGGDGEVEGLGGSSYGSIVEPVDLGSGGGFGWQDGTAGEPGGGAIRLAVGGTLLVEGNLTANGEANPAYWAPGASSGGSIYLTVGTLGGAGIISALGGNTYDAGGGGGGGGGRIAVYYLDMADYSGTISVAGGSGYEFGEDGTIHLAGPDAAPLVSIDTRPVGLVRYPVDHMDVVFTRPIDPATFTPDDIFIWGPEGEVLPSGIVFVEEYLGRQTYRVSFPLQEYNGTYTYSIGPDITGTIGKLLDQDADGIEGEPGDDVYEAAFTIDTVGPRVNRHVPSGDNAGTVEFVDVYFSEPINEDTFNLTDHPEDVRITGPDGQDIPPTGLTSLGNNAYRISFAEQTAPTDPAAGPAEYHVLIGPRIEDIAGNLMDQDRDGDQGRTDLDEYEGTFNLVDVDLTLLNVEVVDPTNLWAGLPAHVSWDGANESGMPLQGDWTDAVYFSTDDRWDIDDVLLATELHEDGLAKDGSYSAFADVIIPGVLPGDYFIIVRSDLYNQEKEEDEELADNIVAVPVTVGITELPADGTPESGALSQTDRSDYYVIPAQSGQSLWTVMPSLPGGAEAQLFISYKKLPTRSSHDFNSTVNLVGNQEILIPQAFGGNYYVLVYGDQLSGDTPYNVTAAVSSQLMVTSVSPESHGTGSIGTMTISGAGFDDSTTVEFIDSGSTSHLPTDINLISTTTIVVTLDLPNWSPDDYDIRIVRASDSDSLEIEDFFQLTPGGTANLETNLVLPSVFGRPWRSTIWIEYENTGEVSMPAPLLKFHGDDDAILTLDESLASTGLHTDTPPAGTSDTVQVMTTGSGATPGILQPGDSGRIPVYYLGLKQPWDYSDTSIDFDLGYLDAESTDVIDWDSLKEQMRPLGTADDAWDAIWANLTDQVGDTWGDYLVMLDDNMNYLHTIGQDTTDIGSLLGFELYQAYSTGPFGSLAGAIDAYVPAPGMPLIFRRTYGSSIDSRYELGPLGRGWSHNWDVSVEVLTDGHVMVHAPGGADRYFENLGSGTYRAAPGDYAVLTAAPDGYQLTEKHGTVWKFHTDNRLNYVEDTNGNQISLGYGAEGLTSITHNTGQQILLEYNAEGRVWYVTDPRGAEPEDDHVTTFEYDASGEYLLTAAAPDDDGTDRVTTYTYDTSGTPQQFHALRMAEFPDGLHDHVIYDSTGRLIETYVDEADPAAHDAQGEGLTRLEQVTFTYDPAGTITVLDAAGRQAVLYFGLGGRLVQVRDGEGNVLSKVYDDDYHVTGLTGPGGQRYAYAYDTLGNLVDSEDPLRHHVTFTYTPTLNNLDVVTDALGHTIDYDYDAAGNLTAITYQDLTSETFTYDTEGTIETWTNRRHDLVDPEPYDGTVVYTHNLAGQITSKDYLQTDGFIDYEYTYDDAGNLLTATDANGPITMTYYAGTDWLETIGYPDGHSFAFEYDALGRRTKRTDDTGRIVNYEYDAVGRLERMTEGADGLVLIVDYDYDTAGSLVRKTLGASSVYTTYDYDDAGRLTRLANYNGADDELSYFNYTYDASGQRTSTATHNGTWDYEYDPTGQLIHAVFASTNPAIDDQDLTYVYDAVGNRIQTITAGVSADYLTNEMNQYDQAEDVTYLYDDDGNLIEKTEDGVTSRYTYNVENRLVRVEVFGDGTDLDPTDTWEYTYDALGNRIASTHNGETTSYVVDPWGFGDVAAEYDGSGTLIARYDHGYGLLARVDEATLQSAYYTFDATGSTSELIDPTGTVLNTYAYDPFGISLTQSETVPDNPFQYVGQYGVMHEANGLEFMRARFYSPTLGRFLAEDPLGIGGGDLNLYSYCSNDAVNWNDPNGEFATWIVATSVILVFVYAVGSLGGLKTGGESLSPIETDVAEERAYDGALPRNQPQDPDNTDPDGTDPRDKDPNDDDDPNDQAPGPGNDFPGGVIPGPAYGKPEKTPDPPTTPAPGGSGGTGEAVDPNDKIAPAGYGELGFVSEDETLAYTIRFENIADATAPAHIITVTDTLDEDLDLSTFELTEIGFADQTIHVPEGFSDYQTTVDLVVNNEFVTDAALRVQIDVSLDIGSRELTFQMMGLDPLTGWLPEDFLLGILYPNDDTGRGDGHISYTISPKAANVTTGDEILNKASIIFDWNDPIETPLVRNTIDAIGPSSAVIALADEITTRRFTVTWDGADDDGGSGIGTYDIYVSTDGGPYERWLDDTPETSAVFTTDPGTHTYAFYSMATDNVGHEEAAPEDETPDAQTTSDAPPVYYWKVTGDGDWDEANWVDSDGNPLPVNLPEYPNESTDVVIRTDTLTIGADFSAFHVTVESGGLIIAPSATLSVLGNFEQLTGTEFTSELDGPNNGLIDITGTATLAGTVNLQATGSLGDFSDLSLEPWGDCTRTIISAAGGLGESPFEVEPTAGQHLGYGVFLTDEGANLQTITYDTNAVLADVFQAAPGDTDGNRKVEGQDILNILQAGFFGDGIIPGVAWGNGDFNGDHKVSGTDILMLLQTGLFGDGLYSGNLCAVPVKSAPVKKSNGAADLAKAFINDRALIEMFTGDSDGPGLSLGKSDWLQDIGLGGAKERPVKKSDSIKIHDKLLAVYEQ